MRLFRIFIYFTQCKCHTFCCVNISVFDCVLNSAGGIMSPVVYVLKPVKESVVLRPLTLGLEVGGLFE